MFIFLNANNLTENKNCVNIRNINVVLSSKIRGEEKNEQGKFRILDR